MALTAKFSADFSEFNKDLANAQDGLKKMEVSTTNLRGQLQRMANSFQGGPIIKQASLTATAIQSIGGATKLTAAEQQRANTIIQEAIEKYRALGQQAPESIRAVSSELKKLQSEQKAGVQATEESGISFSKLAGSYVTAQAAISAFKTVFGAAVQLVADSIQSYANAEAAQKKLTTALKAQGTAAPSVIAHYNDLASSIQKTTVFSDDLTNSAESLLVQIGDVMPSQMDKAIQASTDLAAGLGIDLEQAATLVSKALEGNVGALGRYGIKIDEAALKTQGADAVFSALESRFGGQAQAQLETYAGKVAAIANEWDNVKESIGGAFVNSPTIEAALKLITEKLQGVNEQGEKIPLTLADISEAFIINSGPIVSTVEEWISLVTEADKQLLKFQADQAKRGGSPFQVGAASTAASPEAGRAEALKQQEILDKNAEASKRAAEAAKKYAEEVAKLREQLSGAALEGDLKKLQAAWRGLTTAQQKDPLIGGRLIDSYNKLRAGLHALPADLEAVRAEYQPVIESTRVLNTQWQAYIALAPDVANGSQRVSNALHDLNLNGTLLSHGLKDSAGRLVDLTVQMKSVPAKLTSEHFKEATKATADWGQQLDELASSFAQLAQVSGGSFAGIVKSIGTIISAMSLANKASHQMKVGFDQIKSSFGHDSLGQATIDWSNLGQGIATTATAAIAAAGAIAQATAEGSKAHRVLGGALAGAEAGAAFAGVTGGASIAIGAGIGALVGFVRAEHAAEAAAQEARISIALLGGSIQKTFGTMKLASQIAATFGVNLKEALARGGPEGAALLQAALETLQAKQDHLNDLLETYGIDWKKLGPAFQASHILQNVNQLNQDWADLAGAGVPLDQIIGSMAGKINDFLADALRTGQKLPQQFEPIIEQLIRMGKITDQNARALLGLSTDAEVDFEAMQKVAEKYGISLAALGPKFQAAKIHSAAQDIIDDFQLLVENGANVGGVLDGMSDEISSLVQQAIKTGVTLPDTMKPWILQLQAAGKLVDANGDKLTDLSGLNFEKPLSKAVDDLISKLGELIDKLGDVYGAVDQIPNSIDVGVHYTSDGQIELPDGTSIPQHPDQTHGGGGGTQTGPPPGYGPPPQGHAMGGVVMPMYAEYGRVIPFVPKGSDRVPAMLTPGERVLSVPQTQKIDQWLRGMDRGEWAKTGTDSQPATVHHHTWNINALDGADVERVVRKQIIPMLNDAERRNEGGRRSRLIRVSK